MRVEIDDDQLRQLVKEIVEEALRSRPHSDVVEKAAQMIPLLCSVKAGIALLGRSERGIIDMIARGEIQAVKSDRRTLLVVQSLKDYVARLPRAKGTPNTASAPPARQKCPHSIHGDSSPE